MYKDKYLKYKNKYLNLKNLIGKGIIGKTIFPKNFNTYPVPNYETYFHNFLKYVKDNPNIRDLWMVIGARNNIETDLDRFKNNYDITIDNITAGVIDVNQPDLLTLYNKDDSLYGNIYSMLSWFLPNKFSKIIYDWSVIKFFIDEIFTQLRIIKGLLELNGELYITPINTGTRFAVEIFERDDKYYSKLGRNIIKPENLDDVKNNYISYIGIWKGQRVYNIVELLKYMRPDGEILKNFIEYHMVLYPNDKVENKKYDDETYEKLKEIFIPDNYLIEYLDADTGDEEYPNNPKNTRVPKYWKITRFL